MNVESSTPTCEIILYQRTNVVTDSRNQVRHYYYCL